LVLSALPLRGGPTKSGRWGESLPTVDSFDIVFLLGLHAERFVVCAGNQVQAPVSLRLKRHLVSGGKYNAARGDFGGRKGRWMPDCLFQVGIARAAAGWG
jgi:hypothetical protein